MAQETIDRLLDRLNRERIGAETKMQCKVCWYVYAPKQGCPSEPLFLALRAFSPPFSAKKKRLFANFGAHSAKA